MAVKLKFDINGNPELPTFVIAKRNGNKIGEITNISKVHFLDSMQECPEISFTVNKYSDNRVIPYWNDIKDFKLIWCQEWDTWFEMRVDKNEEDSVTKNVQLKRLGEAELSQIRIYNMEVNTEDDIIRDDYVQPTVFCNEKAPSASLLHRILSIAPHYKIGHVDEHLKGIQRIFSFNDKSIEDCFKEIAEELDVLFVYDSTSDSNGRPNRLVSVYDLKNYCNNCGARGSFVDKCLNCGSTNITEGYGEDTTICVTQKDLGDSITITVNHDNVKNCYRLEAGDDLMTATVKNCNPNGSSYIWHITDELKEDMESDLVSLLDAYDEDYKYYKNSYVSDLSSLPVSSYNALVNKYNPTSNDLNITKITSIVGYAPIMQHYYDTIDLRLYLESGLLPNSKLQDTNAKIEAEKLTTAALSPVAIIDKKYLTLANSTNAVLNATKFVVDPRYKVVVKQSSLNGSTWTGNFTVTNYSDEKDTYDSAIVNVEVNEDYSAYVNQKLKKTLYNEMKGKYGSITQMVEMDATTFQNELTKYNSSALQSFNTCFTKCLSVLSEQGVDKSESELYTTIYQPIYDKLGYIQSEIAKRENEIAVVKAVQNGLMNLKKFINDKLDLEKYLGVDNWITFNAYRREDTYSNSNYISDYLSNKELFERAEEFTELAEYEVFKSATKQHEISVNLKNLMVIPEFKPLLKYFACGNWIRVKDDDDVIYKLRLLNYQLDYDNLESIEVTFSDALRTVDGCAPVREIIMKSSDIINNYNSALNKTNSNFESISDNMTDVIQDSGFNYDYIYDSSNDLKDDLTQSEKEIYADIKVTDDSIRAYVGDVEKTLYSQITQTATEIRAEVKDADEGLSSRITQTAAEIRQEVSAVEDSFEYTLDNFYYTTTQTDTAISVSKDGILQTVSETYYTISNAGTDYQELSSKIEQTANEIKLQVVNKGGVVDSLNDELSSSIEITPSQIKFSSNSIVIDSTNFSLDENGNAEFSGEIASNSLIFKNSAGVALNAMTITNWSKGDASISINNDFDFKSIDIHGAVYILDSDSTSTTSFLGVRRIDCENRLTAGYIDCYYLLTAEKIDCSDNINCSTINGYTPITSNNFPGYFSSEASSIYNQLNTHSNNISSISSDVSSNSSSISTLEINYDEMVKQISGLMNSIGTHSEQISSLDSRITSLENDYSSLSSKYDSLYSDVRSIQQTLEEHGWQS